MAAIEARSLRKAFGGLAAVDDVSFEVADGENFALLGPNGAGKSTLIRLFNTLLLPTSGTALVAGHDVQKDPDAVRRSIGVVPQGLTSDPELTAAENLDFYGKLHRVPQPRRGQLIDELLEQIELSQWRDKLVGTFSMGMRRRLEIARSLVHRPRVLFLDEPTTGLDPASRISMWQTLARMKTESELTIFLTTHYMEEADQACERVAIFDHGKIVALGTAASLKALVAGDETIEASFAAPPPAWKDVVRDLPGVRGVELSNGSCRIHTRDRAGTLAALVRAAGERSVTISTLSLRGSTLEDVFIHFTGRELRDAPGKLDLARRFPVQGKR
ncbi:MAG: multidrug ABC transporter ATP-binding protein [Acidobacteria bacterium]|nr:MAG: multidrug ABC transporter ATP-binding protein [Acidobacteriota bacterium]